MPSENPLAGLTDEELLFQVTCDFAAGNARQSMAEIARRLAAGREDRERLEKWEAALTAWRKARTVVLGLPCCCDTPELHSEECVLIRRVALEGR